MLYFDTPPQTKTHLYNKVEKNHSTFNKDELLTTDFSLFKTNEIMNISTLIRLTLWGRHKMAAVFKTFSNAFSWMKIMNFD